MNRHFRVPPEHKVFWEDLKKSLQIYAVVILIAIATLTVIIHFMP
jgi:hypothetical protein